MRNLFILLLIFTFAVAVFPQKSKTNTTKPAVNKSGSEKSDLENAVKITKAAERIKALEIFIEKYPQSPEINQAHELIISARGAIAEEKLRRDDFEGAVELFKTAVKEAPTPISDKSFTGILSFPNTLYLYGQIIPAYDVADLIYERAAGNRDRLLALATFYIQIENGVYAKKLAQEAVELDPTSAKGYQTLGFANRLIFFLPDAAAAFAKAAELEGEQEASAKRDLADLKRGLGKSDEAIPIYRRILEKFPDDVSSKTGLTLALFDAGQQAEAEAEMRKTLDIDSNNLTLLVGAAYWYAANNQPDKTISLAKEAIVIEPRYVWSYIALARALMLKKNPIEAEKTLLTARQYGNFPTLSYEIATVRMQAGFYREAANELSQNFSIKDGVLSTKLGGRVTAESDNFIELLQLERQASIFQRVAADNSENAEKLKSLLAFNQAVNSDTTDNSKMSQAADNFIKGEDKMKFYRQIFAATRLLETNKANPKVKEIVISSLPLLDSSLNVTNAAAAVLADQLFDTRNMAINNGELIIVPDVPKETLQMVLRGKIEEISGWAEQQDSNPDRAVVHYKRGLSILPKDSALWHSTMWRMGESLQSQGKSKEALDSYIKSYQDTSPNAVRYLVIETLYKQINGTTDGLERKIGEKPATFDIISAVANMPTAKKPIAKTENTVSDNASGLETKITEPQKPAENPVVIQPQTEVKTPVETENKDSINKVSTVIEKPTQTGVIPPKTEPVIETETPVENKNVSGEPTKSAENNKPSEKINLPKTESPNSLFEPIIIGIPKTEKTKTSTSDAANTIQPKENASEKPVETPNNGQTRPRLISENQTKQQNVEPCKIIVTQNNVSLINDGGNLGILVSLEDAPENTKIKAASSSPNDVRVVPEPGIGSNSSSSSFFIISSISKNKGLFSVTFETACAKKEISVNVR